MPESIRDRRPLGLPPATSEAEVAGELRELAGRNRVLSSMIGLGYYGTRHPGRYPTQRTGKPGVVHRVHALPA